MKLLVFSLTCYVLCFLFYTLPLHVLAAPSVSPQVSAPANVQYSATSNCVITKVGNPNASPSPPQGCAVGGSGTSNYALTLVRAITNDNNCQLANGQNGLPTFSTSQVVTYGLPAQDVDYTSQYFRRVIAGDNCLDPIDAQASSLGLTNWSTIKTNGQYLNDRVGGFLQCIGFANAVLEGANGVALTPEHDAQEYANFTTEYPEYIWYANSSGNLSNMHPGDALIFSCDPSVCHFGHIAIAVKVTPATVIVAEGNGKGSGEVDIFPYNTAVNGYAANGGLSLIGWFHKK